jgi:hypothetical protein
MLDDSQPINPNMPKPDNCQTVGKNNTALEMLYIWNREFPERSAKLNLELAKYLVASYRRKFNNQLEQWQNYCKLIKSGQYCTDEEVHIERAINFHTINRIYREYDARKAQALDAKKDLEEISQAKLMQQALQQIDLVDEPEPCKQQRHQILAEIGAANYLAYFKETKLTIGNIGIEFMASNLYAQNIIASKWSHFFTNK